MNKHTKQLLILLAPFVVIELLVGNKSFYMHHVSEIGFFLFWLIFASFIVTHRKDFLNIDLNKLDINISNLFFSIATSLIFTIYSLFAIKAMCGISTSMLGKTSFELVTIESKINQSNTNYFVCKNNVVLKNQYNKKIIICQDDIFLYPSINGKFVIKTKKSIFGTYYF